MSKKTAKTRVNLDGIHSLDISVNETDKTVVAELIGPDRAPDFIYAERFDLPCNYLRTAIKKGLVYLSSEKAQRTENIDKRSDFVESAMIS